MVNLVKSLKIAITILYLTPMFYFAIKSFYTYFILPEINDYAAMHCFAELRGYAVINLNLR